jgi:hypothetical protein
MKPSMAIKPLVFAVAAVMAVAVQAAQSDRGDNDDQHIGRHHNGQQNDQPPRPTMIPIRATANAEDRQRSTDNSVLNQGTVNSAEMSSSGDGTSGNVGVNVAAGAGNQQDNAAAIANAASDSSLDNSFVFGTSNASASVRQFSNGNKVDNYGSTNTATMSGSGNSGSGNMGINIAGGDLNQQKNTMAIANSNAPLGNATATASADQNGPGLVVNNYADRTTELTTLTVTTSSSGSANYDKASNLSIDKSASSSFAVNNAKSFTASGSKTFDVSGTKSVDVSGSRSANSNSASSSTLNAALNATLTAAADASRTVTRTRGDNERTRSDSVDASLNASLDATLNVSVDKTNEKSSSSSFEKAFDASFTKSGSKSFEKSASTTSEKSGSKTSESAKDVAKSYSESSSFDLSNTYSYQVLTPTGWANPVTNTATLSGSVNGGSGNLGVNVAAGVGNQQSNSLAISNQSF